MMKMIQKSYDGSPTLYIVPTPIGNLEDITIRALNILKEVDVIFAEDTRTTKQLLNHFDINNKLISSHLYNENQNEDGYNVVCLPGPTAVIPALVMSGLSGGPFTFYGFLNSKESKRKKELEKLKSQPYPIAFYEAPHRLNKTLNNIYEIFGNRNIAIVREISKKYEEVIRGTVENILKTVENLKGEIVIVVEGNNETQTFDNLSIKAHVNLYIEDGLTPNEAIKKVAKERNVPKSEIYNEYHNL